jgi:hypothetical protein
MTGRTPVDLDAKQQIPPATTGPVVLPGPRRAEIAFPQPKTSGFGGIDASFK